MRFRGAALAIGLASLAPATIAQAGMGVPVRVADTDDWSRVELVRAAVGSNGSVAAVGLSVRGVEVTVSRDLGASWQPPIVIGLGALPKLAVAGALVDVVWRESPTGELRHRRSTDFGRTWGPPNAVSLASPSADNFGGIATAADGRLALLHGAGAPARPWFTRSTDAGLTWSAPLAISGDRGVAVLWTGPDDVLVCSEGFRTYCALSSDGGSSFASFQAIQADFALATMRDTSEVFLAWLDSGVVKGARSTDSGSTWSAPLSIGAGAGGLSMDGRQGELWVHSGGNIQRTTDGVSWTTGSVSPPSPSCARVAAAVIALGTPGSAYVMDGAQALRSSDGGATWASAPMPFVNDDPVAATGIAVTTSARVVSVWAAGGRGPNAVLSSYSDDGGRSWSAAAPVSDAAVPTSQASAYDPIDLAVTATTGGGVVTLWRGAGPACRELRASRSIDGTTFAASTLLSAGASDYSVSDDGNGATVALWRRDTDGELEVARSYDGGATWTTPMVTGLPPSSASGPLVVAPDGALVFVMAEEAITSLNPVRAARSTDDGMTWSLGGVIDNGDASPKELIAAGPRLVQAVMMSGRYGSGSHRVLWESYDNGRTWARLLGEIVPLAGDALGNVYHMVVDELHVAAPGGADLTLGAIDGGLVSAVAPAPWRPLVLYADRTTPAGVFSNTFDPAVLPGLRRDDSIGTLTPPPNLAPLFPIAAYLPSHQTLPGMLDPDQLVVDDGNRPLVLYALDGPARIFLTKRSEAWGQGLGITW